MNKNEIFTSPYKNLENIENKVVVKNIKVESKKFYLDKTKKFKERVRVFAVHGEENLFIFRPSDPSLNKIFSLYMENDWIQRHENIDCATIIEEWVSELAEKSGRRYKPSKKSIERLYKYYMEKLFSEGIGSFKFDW